MLRQVRGVRTRPHGRTRRLREPVRCRASCSSDPGHVLRPQGGLSGAERAHAAQAAFFVLTVSKPPSARANGLPVKEPVMELLIGFVTTVCISLLIFRK
ncbi:conserved hypothetical protein [Burkholderia cenocepacia]|nr:conserved hypothetical protein [Burkholderia cenocepacia]